MIEEHRRIYRQQESATEGTSVQLEQKSFGQEVAVVTNTVHTQLDSLKDLVTIAKRVKDQVPLATACTTNPAEWSVFIQRTKQCFAQQGLVMDAAKRMPNDLILQQLNTRRKSAIELYGAHVPQNPTILGWKINQNAIQNMAHALVAISELEAVQKEYTTYLLNDAQQLVLQTELPVLSSNNTLPTQEVSDSKVSSDSTTQSDAESIVNKESKKEVLKTPEMYALYTKIRERYESKLQKDYAEYGGSFEWKMFKQQYAQEMYNFHEYFQGNVPDFVDAKDWREILLTHDTDVYPAMTQLLYRLESMLNEYDSQQVNPTKPTEVQSIDTLSGSVDTLQMDIDKYMQTIRQKPQEIQQEFDAKNQVFIDAIALTKQPDDLRAMYIVQKELAKNYAAREPDALNIPFIKEIKAVAETISLVSQEMTPGALREYLIEQALQRPVKIDLTPKELQTLVLLKHQLDMANTAPDATSGPEARYNSKEQAYNRMIDAFILHGDVLESIEKKSADSFAPLKQLGWNVTVSMDEIYNPQVVDWLIAATVAATPMTGISDHAFFNMTPIEDFTNTVQQKNASSSPINIAVK